MLIKIFLIILIKKDKGINKFKNYKTFLDLFRKKYKKKKINKKIIWIIYYFFLLYVQMYLNLHMNRLFSFTFYKGSKVALKILKNEQVYIFDIFLIMVTIKVNKKNFLNPR